MYARVSTAEQAEGYSLDHQLDECARYAAGRGWSVADYASDPGVGGGVAFEERPGGRLILERLEVGDIDVVVALRLDRLVRSVRLWVDLIDVAAENGAAVATADGAFDLATSHGRLVAGVLVAMAAFERDLISERTREGLAGARAAGVRLGQRPHDADTLDRVRALVAGGEGCYRIMATLNGEKRRRPDGSIVWTLGATRGAMRAAARTPPSG